MFLEQGQLRTRNRELREENDQLRAEYATLTFLLLYEQDRARRLEAENLTLKNDLNRYNNSNTPSSARSHPVVSKSSNKKGRDESMRTGSRGRPGRKKGHEGVTRPTPIPDEVVGVDPDPFTCSHCQTPLTEEDLVRVEKRVVEEIPKPQPTKVTEYHAGVYGCPNCHRETKGDPPETRIGGHFGPRTHAKMVVWSLSGRWPLRLLTGFLEQDYNLTLCPTTVWNCLNRAAQWLEPLVNWLVEILRQEPVIYIDETSQKVRGKNWWCWTFSTPTIQVIVLDPSRGRKVVHEVLTEDYDGTIVCDGWSAYSGVGGRIQRCWPHLLRKFKHLAPKDPDADTVHKFLVQMFHDLKTAVADDPSPEERQGLWDNALRQFQELVRMYHDRSDETSVAFQKALNYLINAGDTWFTFLLDSRVDPTNNRAERDLRPFVVLRKIKQSLQSEVGALTVSILYSVIQTLRLQELDPMTTLETLLSLELTPEIFALLFPKLPPPD
jgi:transposase